MDVFSEPVFWTAALGIAGVIGVFFAPPWTERRIERRREAREFRRATRLVADEMQAAAEALRFIEQKQSPLSTDVRAFLELPSWEAERGVLATSLPDDVWQTVSHCVEGMEKGRRALSAAQGAATPVVVPLGPDALATVRKQADELDSAAALLLEAKPVKD